MLTHFIEASDGTAFNHGKFMLAAFDAEEWSRTSVIARGYRLLGYCGWDPKNILVLDVATGEGAIFRPDPRASASADLNQKHKIWVCPMFEPFLQWLYQQDCTQLTSLPHVVDLGAVPTALSGYRRQGAEVKPIRRSTSLKRKKPFRE
jgi:hypothetical protein